jgi:cytochrome c553
MKKQFASVLILASSAFALNAWAGGNVAAGKAAAEKYNCASCHGKDYNTPIDPTYPKLAGQHAEYLEHALIAYQRGKTAVNANGRGNAIMEPQAKQLSRKEIQDIGAYLHSLPGSMVVRR